MKNAWLNYTKEETKEINELGNRYKDFLSNCKTERECTERIISEVEEKGFQNIEEYIKQSKQILPGNKIYVNNRGKSLALFVIGQEDITDRKSVV